MKKITKLKRASLSDFTLCRTELLHTKECPKYRHSSSRFEMPQNGIMLVSLKLEQE